MAGSELAEFFFILTVIYVSECVWWVRFSLGVFVPLPLGGWKWKRPRDVFSSQYGGTLLINLLPNLRGTFLCAQFPVFLSVTHASSAVFELAGMRSSAEAGAAVSYEQMKSIEAIDGDISINGKPWVKCGEHVVASHAAQVLTRLAALPAEQREQELTRIMRTAFDAEAARERMADYARKAIYVKWGSAIVFWYVFGLAPTVVNLFGASTYLLLGLVAPLPVMSAVVTFLFFRVHRIFYPDLTSDRIVQALKMLLFPPGAARANAALSRGLLIAYHPVAVASVLFDGPVFEAVAKGALLDLTYPIASDIEAEETSATEKYYREHLKKVLVNLLAEAGLEAASLLMPPQRVDSSSKAYCPRCLCHYERTEGHCTDCPGVSLAPLEP